MKLSHMIPFLVLWSQETEAYRILALFPFAGVSQFYNSKVILDELVNRGHHVTVITVFKTDKPKPNYEEIIVDKKLFWDYLGTEPDMFSFQNIKFEDNLNLLWDATFFTNEFAINSTNFQYFLKKDESHFDLIFTEIFYQEALYMFAHKYKAPIVGLATFGYCQFIGDFMGNPNILPYMTHEFLNFGKKLSFFERLANIYATGYDLFWRKFYLLPKHQKLAEKHFNHLPGPLPKLEDIERNISLVLINSHFSNGRINPLIPGIVEIAGAHIKKPKVLPEKFQTFLDESKEGVIYFNFGTNLRIKDMPMEKFEIFRNTFKNIKQRILWKWEDESFTEMPDNVMISKWLPQNDVLAHPNIKAFISHGGSYSTQESIYHGVPIIGFPIYGDQHPNVDRLHKSGCGIKLTFDKLTEDSFSYALNEILYNPKYMINAKEMSQRFKDRPLAALDTAVYWIEYVIRNRGASFMKSPIAEMTSIEYHMLDSITCVVITLITAIVICKRILVLICNLIFNKSQKPVFNKDKKRR